jgi:predicted nucleic acid-binding protein
MKVLLDTNIVIHREASRILDKDIGILFRWLDKGRYEKCVHPVTIQEVEKNSNKETASTLGIKLESYKVLKTTTPLAPAVVEVSQKIDVNENDKNDTILLNEVFVERIDFLITEDKKIHKKAELLGIADRVFNIDSFLEKVVSENPDLVDYKVLSVTKKHFGEINLADSFFDSFREDYKGFDKWFLKKSDETAYVTINKGNILSFLFLKVENEDENYSDIMPVFTPKKRLKIGTFKVISNGVRLGERFMKIIFDNAIQYKVDEIYVTIFDKREEQKRLIGLLEDWGFINHGQKTTENGVELVYVRDFRPTFNKNNPKLTFPYLSKSTNIFMIPIYPEYHTDLMPDSILTTESPYDFVENQPHRNAISKVYICRSIERNINKGDVIVFYRTAAGGRAAYYTSVITTIAIAEGKIVGIKDENDFILKCRKRSVFSDDELKKYWNFKPSFRPFIINFLYTHSFPTGKRINRQQLLDLGILTGAENEIRGLKRISKEQFELILKETETNESLIVDQT